MTEKQTNYRIAFIVVTALFFLWGFITVLNDILIPHLRDVFKLSYAESMLVQFAFFLAYGIISLIYFLVSLSSGDPISRFGYKRSLVFALIICGLGCSLFYVAAEAEQFIFFLIALFVLASGVTILQIAANPYVAILGQPETASSRLNLAQAFNSLGTTLAPLVGGSLIFAHVGEGVDAVKVPYLGLAGSFLLLAFIVSLTKLPAFSNEVRPGTEALRFPQLRFGMLAIFFYVGGEVAIGSVIINFLGLPEVMHLPKEIADSFLSYYWGGAMIGRFLGAIALSDMKNEFAKYGLMAGAALATFLLIFFITGKSFDEVWPWLVFIGLNFIGFIFGRGHASRMLALFATIVIALIGVAAFTHGAISMWCLLAIGLFNSVMWSNIFTLAIRGLGPYTSQGSSLLVMMIIGGALVPPVVGKLADQIGLQYSILVAAICYAYLIFYGLIGSRGGRDADETTQRVTSTH